MASFCRQCGTRIPDDASFCPNCGQRIQSAPAAPYVPQPGPAPGPSGTPQRGAPAPAPNPPQRRVNGTAAVPHSPERQTQRANTEKPKKKKGRGMSLFLVVVMLVELAVAAFKYPGFLVEKPDDGSSGQGTQLSQHSGSTGTDSSESGAGSFANGQGPGSFGYQSVDGTGIGTRISYTPDEVRSAPLATADITVEEPRGEAAGVSCDFGKWNLDFDSSTLMVRTLPDKVDADNGYACRAWNISLDNQDEFYLPVEVRLPYGDLGGSDPADTVFCQRYNGETGRWEHVAYEIDESARMAVAYVEQNGQIGVFTLLPDEEDSSVNLSRNAGDLGFFDWITGSAEEKPSGPVYALTAWSNQRMKVKLKPARLQNACSQPNVVELVRMDCERVARLAEKGAKQFYGPETVGETISRNLGNIYSLADFTQGIADVAGVVPDSVGNAFTGISTILTICETVKECQKQKSYVDAFWTALYYLPEYLPTFLSIAKAYTIATAGKAAVAGTLVFAPEFVALIGCALFVRSVANTDLSELTTQSKKLNFNAFDHTYYGICMADLCWSKKEKKIVLAPEEIHMRRMRALDKESYNGLGFSWRDMEEVEERYAKYPFPEHGSRDLIRLDTKTGGAGWACIMNTIMKQYPQEPEKWIPSFEKYVSDAAELRGVPYSTLLIYKCIQYPDAKDVRKESRDMGEYVRNEIFATLAQEEFYQSFIRKCQLTAVKIEGQRRGSTIEDINRTVTFRLVNQNGDPTTFDQTAYKGKYIIFETMPRGFRLQDKKTGKPSPWLAPMKSSQIAESTYYGYLMAGKPCRLNVYDSKESFEEGFNPESQISFQVVEKGTSEVLIKVEDANEWKVEDYLGGWLTTDTDKVGEQSFWIGREGNTLVFIASSLTGPTEPVKDSGFSIDKKGALTFRVEN
ncbi:MAG: zinc ribbon domain-containing protein [Oscillospiraceae bacterium]|nr:zinc ribbon domain-containing protein [Oscillospiraceae bacterium]